MLRGANLILKRLMAKRPGPGKCVHCLKDVKERNWDHVFPASWYPESTPGNLDKWQIPSCISCNSAYGRLEEDLLCRVGLCLDPYVPASQSIVKKALRSMNPAAARNQRDAKHRLNKRRQILSESLSGAKFQFMACTQVSAIDGPTSLPITPHR
jgi:hypothetical protein